MPTNLIKKLNKEGKGSIQSLETKWNEAKSKAADEGQKDNYAYITTIFKSMVGASTQTQINAAARLKATT